MQKETVISKGSQTVDELDPRATSETQTSEKSDGSADNSVPKAENQNPTVEKEKTDSKAADFEELIKGPYKDAFAKKVQSIINKRFKEQKTAENKAAEQNKAGETPETEEKITQKAKRSDLKQASAYENLIAAGVDPETAYRVLHLNEFMDSSMRYGAELAAKQLAESIKSKASRPSESALADKGFTARTSVSALTPEKRKELAKKALMGEQIGF